MRKYPNGANLAGRVALQTIFGAKLEAMCSVGAIVCKNFLSWSNQRRYIPYAPLTPPANITDLAGRLVAISDPITTPSGNFLVAKVSALGGNLYQDSCLVIRFF